MYNVKISFLVVLASLSVLSAVAFVPTVFGERPQNASGGGETVVIGPIATGATTHFGFTAVEHQDGTVTGRFECLVTMPGGKAMDVKAVVTGLTVAPDGSSATLTGMVTVTGFGAGTGTFTAVVTPGGAGVGTATLTTDVDGSGIEGDAGDGGEGPFIEVVTRGQINVNP